jgi:hypothetical protein
VLYPQKVSLLLKQTFIHLAHFFLDLNLLGRVWEPAADYSGCVAHFKLKKSAPNGYYYRQLAARPDQIILAEYCSLQNAGGPKGSRGTLGFDFQANT